MPIYRNNQQVNKIYQGTTEISKVYHNNSLIHEQVAPKIDKILIHDFGGKDYFPIGYTHGEWTSRKNTNATRYYSMILNKGVVKPFKMPFNATKASLMLECCLSRRRGVDQRGYCTLYFGLTNNPDFDASSQGDWDRLYSGGEDSTFWKNQDGTYMFKNSNFVEEKVLPTYPDMKYLYRLSTASFEPGFYRREYTDGTQDTYFIAYMYQLTQSDYNKNNDGLMKLGKVYLDLTTDPQYQTYLNS